MSNDSLRIDLLNGVFNGHCCNEAGHGKGCFVAAVKQGGGGKAAGAIVNEDMGGGGWQCLEPVVYRGLASVAPWGMEVTVAYADWGG